MSFLSIGWSSDQPLDRFVGWSLRRLGWRGFVRTVIQPQLDWGVRRFLIHNPFGINPVTRAMEFDEALTARQAGATWLLEDFAEAWAPIVAQDIEVMAYLGTLEGTPSFKDLAPGAWWARAWGSMTLPLSAGMSIGFDYSAGVPADGPVYRLLQMLDVSGVRTYIEAWPAAACPHLWKRNWVIQEEFYQNVKAQLASGQPQAKWAQPRKDLSGQCVRLVTNRPADKGLGDPSWIVPSTRTILADGDTAAAQVFFLMAHFTRRQLLGE